MRIAPLILAMILPASSLAAECTARSGPNTNALVELYTSEGCDSCPPADRWLSQTGDRPSLSAPDKAGLSPVFVAFHVDYWDYLGWKDAYAQARFSERQRNLARAIGARAVYTPQVVVAGRDFSWRGASTAKTFEAVNAKPATVKIEIASASGPSARVHASLDPGMRSNDLALLVAITQNGLVTQVKAGENRGETLRLDFVVRDLRTERGWSEGGIDARVEFSPRADWKLDRMNVVAFVQNTRTGEVLQALSAPVCP